MIAVFAFPANDSFDFAGKKCERSKSEVRCDRKERMLEICESFLSDVSAAREAIPEWKIDFGTLCSSS